MPGDDRHQEQKSKNIALLLILFGLMVLVYAITVMRIKSGT